MWPYLMTLTVKNGCIARMRLLSSKAVSILISVPIIIRIITIIMNKIQIKPLLRLWCIRFWLILLTTLPINDFIATSPKRRRAQKGF